jgi:hypothetical protein
MKILTFFIFITIPSVLICTPFNDYCTSEYDNECKETKPNIIIPNYSIKPTPKQLCDLCYIAMPVIRSLIDQNKTEHFEQVAVFFCNEFKIVDKAVCSLVIKQYEVKKKTTIFVFILFVTFFPFAASNIECN